MQSLVVVLYNISLVLIIAVRFCNTIANQVSCGSNLYLHEGSCKCPRMLWDKELEMFRAYGLIQQQCWPVYIQGPCLPSEWVVIRSSQAQCEFNPCNFKDSKYVPYKGLCVTLNKGNTLCEGTMKLSNTDGATPNCVESLFQTSPLSFSLPDPVRRCPGKLVMAFDGNCYPEATY